MRAVWVRVKGGEKGCCGAREGRGWGRLAGKGGQGGKGGKGAQKGVNVSSGGGDAHQVLLRTYYMPLLQGLKENTESGSAVAPARSDHQSFPSALCEAWRMSNDHCDQRGGAFATSLNFGTAVASTCDELVRTLGERIGC